LSVGLACVLVALTAPRPSTSDSRTDEPRKEEAGARPDEGARREDALARAKVWEAPARGAASLGANPKGPGSFALDDNVSCRFEPKPVGGSTPKFECRFGDEVLKVKYGSGEVHTEAAATRLLSALGFGSDRVYLLRRLRCFGCPENPQAMLSCISSPFREVRRECQPLYGQVSASGSFEVTVDYGRHVDFGPVAIERRKEGQVIRTDAREGWGFDELDRAQTEGRGESRARRDALRLLAVFLNDWDTRTDNQRLICLGIDPDAEPEALCARPFAYLQDVGATFGQVGGESKAARKLDVEGWSQTPIWKDPVRCTVAIKSPPLHGATFGEATISESGRLFLAQRLSALSARQIRSLFEGALFTSYADASPASQDAGNWVRAFEDKVRQIVKRPPCPTP
jgi:hypothetical protein